jgi:hypothetical protein
VEEIRIPAGVSHYAPSEGKRVLQALLWECTKRDGLIVQLIASRKDQGYGFVRFGEVVELFYQPGSTL